MLSEGLFYRLNSMFANRGSDIWGQRRYIGTSGRLVPGGGKAPSLSHDGISIARRGRGEGVPPIGV